MHENSMAKSVENSKDVLLRQGLKFKSQKGNELLFVTRIGQHLTYHPFFFVSNVKLILEPDNNETIDSKQLRITYTVNHWVPLIVLFVLSVLSYDGFNNPVTYFPLIIFSAYLTFIPTMQYSIFKEIIASLSE